MNTDKLFDNIRKLLLIWGGAQWWCFSFIFFRVFTFLKVTLKYLPMKNKVSGIFRINRVGVVGVLLK